MSLDASAVGLARHAQRLPDKVALVAGEKRVTYGVLNARVNRLARALRRIGIGAGDSVAAILHNGVEWIELLNAVGKIGAQLVPVGYRLKGPEIEYMLNDSRATAIVAAAELSDEVERGLAGLSWDDDRLWVVGSDQPWRGLSYEAVLAVESSEEPQPAFTGGGYNVLIYTSGTTGRPRAVERPSDPATAHLALAGVADMWDFDEREVHLCAGPLYHTGPGSYAQLHILIGATLVLMRHFDAASALALIEGHRVTNAFMVPTHFTRILMLEEEEQRDRDLSSLRLVMHSAAPCPVHVKRGIMRLFPPGSVTEFYGASESGFTRITAQEWLHKPGSVGRPWPGHELLILDEHGAPCAAGEVGLIYVRSARTDFRYRDSEEKNRGAFRNGFFTAGDLGYLDDDGYLFIADRRTDLIISGGANVYPAEVEGVIMQHSGVADVAVLGVPDDEMGKSVLAVVEPRPGVPLTADEVIAFTQANLALYKCPRRVELVSELPREPQGKIKKHELLEKYWPL